MAPPRAGRASTELAADSSGLSLGAALSRVKGAFRRGEEATSRTFEVECGGGGAGPAVKKKKSPFVNNLVSTAKYSLITFIPKSLFEQFRRLANVYFLVIVVLLMIGTYTTFFQAPLTPYTTLLPLVLVLSLTMLKEGFEDLKRHLADLETNNRTAYMLSLEQAGALDEVKWKDIAVGRVVKVLDKQEIPADMILLTSSEHEGNCYVETSNIDGETNLKVKQAAKTSVDGTGPLWKDNDPAELFGWRASVECELPNSRIHSFTGLIHHWQHEQPDRETPVDQANLLLRGSTLRNTKWVLGLVVFTGYDTKIVRNSRAAPSKLSTVEQTVNKLLYLILGTQVVLATVSLLFYSAWSKTYYQRLDYICLDAHASEDSFYGAKNCGSARTTSLLGMWVTFFTLFNNFVPISLYVTLEMVNYCQAFYIDSDLQMYDAESDTPAVARTSNMNGDLASVQYVFSDKTGTLTQNVMRFKRCSVAGTVYGNLDDALRPDQDGGIMGRPLEELAGEARRDPGDGVAQAMVRVLSLCHTVVMERMDDGSTAYQAESPDEEALVSAAEDLGYRFSGRGPGEARVVLPSGEEARYEVLCTIPFTSTRKRMSVIVRLPTQDRRILLLCKGADNVITERASSWRSCSREDMDEHLRVFALDGLRTLMLAQKELSEAEFSSWFADWQRACAALSDREERMGAVAERIEAGLTVVGATAIEDKLQDGVPETISDLKDSGIKVWVLTGDKMETAINIGYSCKLIGSDLVLLKLKDEGDADEIRSQLKRLVRAFGWLIEKEKAKKDTLVRRVMERMNALSALCGCGDGGDLMMQARLAGAGPLGRPPSKLRKDRSVSRAESMPDDDPQWNKCYDPQADAPPFRELTSEKLALVVDGPALVHVFGDKRYEELFLRLAGVCGSVIACRVSPAQKRMVVRLVKKGVTPKPITLSIGDGANDVAMIQEAQIGVGISGKEGKQAVNSADFAIAQFRFLRRLLLIHGRWDYRRTSKVILYSFYKNIVLTMILFYFNFFTGFSGQSLFDDWVYAGYNFFLAMPIICVGIFDRDMREASVLRWKWVYMSGRDHLDLNLPLMLQWLAQALLDSVLIFFLCVGANGGPYGGPVGVWGQHGDTTDLAVFGTTVYSAMFLAMILKAGNATLTWTWVSWFFFWGSILLYLIFLFGYGSVLSAAQTFYRVPEHMMRHGSYWLLVLLVPAVSFLIDYGVMAGKAVFCPTPVDIAIERDRLLKWGTASGGGKRGGPCSKLLATMNRRGWPESGPLQEGFIPPSASGQDEEDEEGRGGTMEQGRSTNFARGGGGGGGSGQPENGQRPTNGGPPRL